MNRICKFWLCASFATFAVMASFADTEVVDGVTWTYMEYNGEVSLGWGASSTAVPTSTTGAITIPSSLGGKPVTRIGDGAFAVCSGLTNVAIPNSVTSIGLLAFYGCSGLTSVTIPNSVTIIGGSAFGDCSGLKSVTIPSSVTSIVGLAFDGCKSLASVNVSPGDANRVKKLMKKSGFDVSGVRFIEADAAVRHYQKAQTLTSVVWTEDGVAVLSVKTGKVNKSGVVSVSGSIMGMDGKKLSVKSAKLKVDADERLCGTLQVKDGSAIDITIDGDAMWGDWEGDEFESDGDEIGGAFEDDRELTFYFASDIDEDAWPDGTVMDLLPEEEPITVKKGKWSFAKAASVKWAKPKGMVLAPEIYDEASGKGLIVDESKGKTNLSGLKLTYTPKTGLFKGSFKVYAIQRGKLKKYTAKVTGIVVNGTGYGTATGKGLGSFAVEID